MSPSITLPEPNYTRILLLLFFILINFQNKVCAQPLGTNTTLTSIGGLDYYANSTFAVKFGISRVTGYTEEKKISEVPSMVKRFTTYSPIYHQIFLRYNISKTALGIQPVIGFEKTWTKIGTNVEYSFTKKRPEISLFVLQGINIDGKGGLFIGAVTNFTRNLDRHWVRFCAVLEIPINKDFKYL